MRQDTPVQITFDGVRLEGDLLLPEGAYGLVLFAHGSGSSRFSPRNKFVAEQLEAAGLGSLLFDLLTPAEGSADEFSGEYRFDIEFLARRLAGATDWIVGHTRAGGLPIGYFGASTGGAAALVAAARRNDVGAIVCRGARPDLAGDALERVTAPTLLIVGGEDFPVIRMNELALQRLTSTKRLQIIPGATHLFEEPGALETVAELTADWFRRYFGAERAETALAS